jgi:NAD(P)-dependent dehydrogenase (short-subunit alcohol dehydrogenase family)
MGVDGPSNSGFDVAVVGDVEAAVGRAVDAHGGLDVLVNNAGLIEPIARLADSDPDEWTKVADVNYKGVYFGLRAALPVMLGSGGGTVVNVSSGAATSALEGWSHYCSSKAAALSLTACAHKEYGAEGIRVLGISPGTVRTDMQVAIKASGINPVSQLDPSVHIPAEWVAKAIAWLCTEASDDWLGRDFPLRSREGRAAIGLPAD